MIINTQPKTWREGLGAIKAARDEYKRMIGYPDTPQYLRETARDEIDRVVKQYYPVISAGALGEFETAVTSFQEARANLSKAKAAEIKRWDPRAMLAHMDLYRERLAGILDSSESDAGAIQEIETLYQEALSSDDIVMARAAAEVFKSVPAMIATGADRSLLVAANGLKHQAERDLVNLRQSEEYTAAEAALDGAAEKLIEQRSQLLELAQTIDGDPVTPIGTVSQFGRAALRVAIRGGKLDILEPTDPEVTGIDWLPDKVTAGDNQAPE